MVAKVIPLSRCSQCEADEERDFEAWEEYVELFERGDFPGLVRLYEADLRRWPDDVNTHCELGDAYVRNGQPQRAIDFLTPLHRADSEQTAYHHAILDALFALGRTEKDFDWVVAPRVYRLGPEVLDACFQYLSSKRRPRLVFELAGAVAADGYQAFSADELLAALRRDVRFVVEPGIGLPGVSVARDGRRRHRGGGRGPWKTSLTPWAALVPASCCFSGAAARAKRGGRASQKANAAGRGVSPQNLRPNAPRKGVTRGDATY